MEKRIIKFRAWDKENNIMLSHKDLNDNDRDGVMHLMDILENQEKEGVVLMQFTNLHDKNGVEIYESDLLKDVITGMTYVVKFGLCKKFAYNGWYVENDEQNYSTSLNGDCNTASNSQIAVIGNIHQNSNLL